VGDTVTAGETSGTVLRCIRATTITDWDRRELIVPNKEFISFPPTGCAPGRQQSVGSSRRFRHKS
jgi:hypothetical protein